ncbi:hypothetical protein [Nostoc sp. XA010]|nr:hypothetical protein [Nostoc sp. XA010]
MDFSFVPEAARAEVIRFTRWQLSIYTAAIAISIAVGQPWFLLY